MKRIWLIVCVLVLSWHCSWADVVKDRIMSEVVAGMHCIPLFDGKSVFDDKVTSVAASYDLEHIDNDGALGFHLHAQLLEYFYNPIKEAGMFHTTYYSAKEILDVYKELAELARRLNPDAVAFFKDLLTCGNMYQYPLPDLCKQPERGEIFKRVFYIRFDKPHDSMAKLQGIRDDLIAEEEARARAELPKPAPKQEEPAVRRRKVAAEHSVNTSGREIDASSDKTPLLPKRIPVH